MMYQIKDRQILQLALIMLIFFSSTTFGESNKTTDDEIVSLNCSELGDCPSGSMKCHNICGCDRFAAFYYNETSGQCILSLKHLIITVMKNYVYSDMPKEHGMAYKIEMEANEVFNTLLISVLLFIACSTLCVISACCYCGRIIYTDYKLNSDMKGLAKKVNRNKTFKKSLKNPLPTPAAQTYNIICEDAGVFVV